ncbi:hypothetical protein SAMN06265365_13512 [Tistlia consotensis]|uniref:Uncharacterized protein n=1 Tax=Tistlia consotensis USBA 355 TaxID=560819 RepID=A0A1Y6CV99_9PROT|nr:hypothetical protein [Tistlia consotensis]SMF79830.1 hypothetical protein SAMN05428998_14039 [Tistlia consotensis USBA 355]SNS16535.1 hypothetical protein SAMN06265365_13512 [Tistlia consotensis]
MSCTGTVALQAVPVLGSSQASGTGTNQEVTLVTAEENTAGVLVVLANVYAEATPTDPHVSATFRTTDQHLLQAFAQGTETSTSSASTSGGPFIVPAGKKLIVSGTTERCGYNINYEILS